jgi:hypothetical protein
MIRAKEPMISITIGETQKYNNEFKHIVKYINLHRFIKLRSDTLLPRFPN